MATSLTFAVPVNWSSSQTYEVNMIVFVGKKAYTALQNVPTGIDIENTAYWAETGVPYVDVSDIRTALNALDTEINGTGGLDDQVTQAKLDIIANANSITTLTTRLNNDILALEAEVARVNNVMVTLYTPYTPPNNS